MAEVITERVTFDPVNCASCGFHYFVPKATLDLWRKDATTFYCPRGHSNWYGTSEADRLRKEVAAAKQREETIRAQRDNANTERDRAWASLVKAEAARKKLTKRVAAGVCPCCHRTVSQMARHMKTKHPDFPAQRPGGKNG